MYRSLRFGLVFLFVLAAVLTTSAGPAARAEGGGAYTGLLIDARNLPEILRSPAPAIYGPAPEGELLYPDRSHVPTPDEVQDQSIVRYYHSVEEAKKGYVGDTPLILPAEAVLGYAKDSLRVNAENAALLKDLDKKIRFSRSWKVGFLVPEGH